MSIDLLSILDAMANAVASHQLMNFISDRMSYLLRNVADSNARVAERHLNRAKNVADKNSELTAAASSYETAAENYLSAFHSGSINDKTVNDLRAAISCYLSASLCYKAKGDGIVTHELMARAGNVFYRLYIDAVEYLSFGESLADRQVHRFSGGSAMFGSRKARILEEGYNTVQRLENEDEQFIRFCTANGKPRWNKVCDYDKQIRKSQEYGGQMLYDHVTVTISRRGGWPPSWI
jgi:hypothetical protein